MTSTMYEDTERPRTIISAFCVWQKLLETCKTQNESEQTTSEHIQAPAFQIYPPRSIPERSDNCKTTIIKPQGITAPLGTETLFYRFTGNLTPGRSYFRTHGKKRTQSALTIQLCRANKLNPNLSLRHSS